MVLKIAHGSPRGFERKPCDGGIWPGREDVFEIPSMPGSLTCYGAPREMLSCVTHCVHGVTWSFVLKKVARGQGQLVPNVSGLDDAAPVFACVRLVIIHSQRRRR